MSDETALTTVEPTVEATEKPADTPAKKQSNALVWLAIFIVFILLIGACGAGYFGYTQFQQTLASQSESQLKGNESAEQQVAQLKASIASVDTKISSISDSTMAALQEELSATLSRFDSFEQSVKQINNRLTELSPRDEQQWMISQIEYFLKMAQYRMNLTGDHQGAALLMDQASVVAAQLRSPEAKALLEALSTDRASLKIEGHWQPELIHAQLNTLIEQIPTLTVSSYKRTDFDDLKVSEESSVQKLVDQLVRVQRSDKAVKPLLDDTTRKQVEQHMFMLLTESQLNLMRQNQEGFESALGQLGAVVKEAFNADRKEAAFFLDELERLKQVQIAKPITTLDASEQALRNLVQIFEKQNG